MAREPSLWLIHRLSPLSAPDLQAEVEGRVTTSSMTPTSLGEGENTFSPGCSHIRIAMV